MVELTCYYCQESVSEGQLLCPACGGSLVGTPTVASPLPRSSGEVEAPRVAPGECPRCGADVPDPGNLICVSCLEPLNRDPGFEGAGAGAGTLTGSGAATGTRRDVPRTLTLDFPGGRVTIRPGGSAVLGRDPVASPYAPVFQSAENVSRRHATLGVASSGAAWVRDEDSTNGTYVNGAVSEAGVTTALRDGDRLRLAADVESDVRLVECVDG
ncbi:FHA domain-containing protein [Sphaerisporangium sp. TRM90804]|uniref:FHA domain-containing protein n=1 Tax=Sphaerisporangium sp. TRM90804 TaxID=3031113 RepID=UPI00244917EF|nr:FHA domain-containing protein [Sphaerisporangium sp. TRM90804]MDH2425660.1 FHA domain-containing protein [Sphaerisporangium sp. TRM90804]